MPKDEGKALMAAVRVLKKKMAATERRLRAMSRAELLRWALQRAASDAQAEFMKVTA